MSRADVVFAVTMLAGVAVFVVLAVILLGVLL
jgi:hypothetical protein